MPSEPLFIFVLFVFAFLGIKAGITASVRTLTVCTMLVGVPLAALFFFVQNGIISSTGNALADGLWFVFMVVFPNVTLVLTMWLSKGVAVLLRKKRTVS